MNNIHSSAIISPKAKLGENITIAPFVIIEDDVEIGNDCWIGPNVVIYNGARIGNSVKIHQGASISNSPQDLKYAGEPTNFFIGDNTVIREYVTLHRGTMATKESRVGKNCLLMAYSHIAHDCVVGNNCILANSVNLGGHVHVEDWVIIGGICGVHQFSRIGQHAMVGTFGRVVSDIPPYILTGSEPVRFAGLNVIGLRRRGFSNEDIAAIKEAYRIFYQSGLNFSQAREKIEMELGENQFVRNILDFVSSGTRSIVKK